MNFRSILFIGAISASTYAIAAPGVDISLHVSNWQVDYSGQVGQNGNYASLDELGFDDKSSNNFGATIRHAVPFVPNVKIQRTSLEKSATGVLQRNFTFADITFNVSDTVDSTMDLSHTDVTLFYTPIDTVATFDVGITGRYFDSTTKVESSLLFTEATIDAWIPMLHLGVGVDIPTTDIYLQSHINYTSYSGDSLSDLSIAAGYQYELPTGSVFAELGYRFFNIDVDIDDYEGDVDLDGLFLNVGVTF